MNHRRYSTHEWQHRGTVRQCIQETHARLKWTILVHVRSDNWHANVDWQGRALKMNTPSTVLVYQYLTQLEQFAAGAATRHRFERKPVSNKQNAVTPKCFLYVAPNLGNEFQSVQAQNRRSDMHSRSQGDRRLPLQIHGAHKQFSSRLPHCQSCEPRLIDVASVDASLP